MERILALDGLRAVAALVVLAYHTVLPGLRRGYLGVDIFFVLSGFVITRLFLLQSQQSQPLGYGRFLFNRMVRLLPVLVVTSAAFWIVAPHLFQSANRDIEIILAVSYLSNVTRMLFDEPVVLQHTWSLAAEMQFYMAWPLLLAVALKRGGPTTLYFVLVTLLLAIAFRTGMQFFEYTAGRRLYYSLEGRAPSLLVGALVAVLPVRIAEERARALIAGLGTAFIIIAMISAFDVPAVYLEMPLVEIGTALVILSLASGESVATRILSVRALVLIGVWSYALYVWHYPIARYFRVQYDGVYTTLLVLAVTLPLSAITYYVLERPLNEIARDIASRFGPRGARPMETRNA